MDISKKVSYIKGLADGLELDKESKEGKVIAAILDVLDDMADTITEMAEEMDAISEDLGDVEDIVYDDEDDDDDCCCCDDDDCCDDDCCCCDDDEFEAECPSCGEDVVISDEALDAGYVVCPKCGEKLEFEFEDDDEDEE
jgi:hypothetical protein